MVHQSFKLKLPLKGAYYIVFLSFILTLAAPLLSPIFPIFIKSFVAKEAYVGYIGALLSLLLLISNVLAGKCLEYTTKVKLLKIATLGYSISFIILIFVKNVYQFLFLELFKNFFLVASYISLGLLLRDLSKNKNIGKIEGWSFTIANVAFLIGPLIGGLVAEKYSYTVLFSISALFPMLVFLLLMINPLKIKENKTTNHKHTLENIKSYFKKRNLTLIYISSIGLLFWWTVVYLYIPLYLVKNNLGIDKIGLFLALITIPLILLEIPAGKLADKFGYKKFLFFGFLFAAICASLTYFTNTTYTMVLFVIASIGFACIEPLREAFFFKIVSKEYEKAYYPIFKTGIDVGRILCLIILSTVLLYSNFKIVFVTLAVCMGIFSLLMLLIKEK